MKLPDFSKHPHFVNLLRTMGVTKPSPWNAQAPVLNRAPLPPLDLDQLSTTGIDVEIDLIELDPDGSLVYQGKKILVYIRDQEIGHTERASGYKYHIAECKTLYEMRSKNRFDSRYVATNRRDGMFLVNRISGGQIVEENREIQLSVCKNCLRRLNYLGYETKKGSERRVIYDDFSLDDFFARYSSTVRSQPPHNEHSMPLNKYPDDWNEISASVRRQANWRCEECGVQLGDNRKFLHAHHKDGNKANNGKDNLQVLCIACHSKAPGHDRLKQHPLYNEYIQTQTSRKTAIR